MAVQDDTQLRSKVEKMTGDGVVTLTENSVNPRYDLRLAGRYPELGIAYFTAIDKLENGEFKELDDSPIDDAFKSGDSDGFLLLSGYVNLGGKCHTYAPQASVIEKAHAFYFLKREYKRLLGKTLSGRAGCHMMTLWNKQNYPY